MSGPEDLVGCIVKHQQLGLARITDVDRRFIVLSPFDRPGSETRLGLQTALRDMERHRIPDGWQARSADGVCTIEGWTDGTPFVYDVLRVDGVREQLPETQLEPVDEPPANTIEERFGRLDFDKLRSFSSREELLGALESLEKDLAGLRPLLASRIDIYPHQAFVAGAVLLDHNRRYLLADEVGLGKTIEAGIVAQDILAASEGARILVVCPGALTHQWLAEFYSKFGGRVFRILDLADADQLAASAEPLAIASTSFVLQNAEVMEHLPQWDLLIVDEAHRLIHSGLYDQIARMSARSNALLLLSALPARRRADELYRLLLLLDPEFYATSTARERFDDLYTSQRAIGRRIRLAERRVKDFRNGEEPAEAVVEAASRLRDLPVVSEDPEVSEAFRKLDLAALDLADRGEAFTHLVADRYRISRRIFRNRRERLFEEGQMPRVERRLRSHLYPADQVEFEAVVSVLELLESASKNGVPDDFGMPLARMFLQASADPSSIRKLVGGLRTAKAHEINEAGRELVAEGHLSGYSDSSLRQDIVFAGTRAFVSEALLQRAVSDVEAWADSGESARLQTLVGLLRARSEDRPPPKCLVFAGHPGLAEDLCGVLRTKLGSAAVAEFRSELSPKVKEENVLRFKSRPETWILVSDETGGEGRNFQYVDEIFHFDLPWDVSALEQRIGRLDRIGRRAEVVSNVITADGSIEHAFLHCLDEGLGLFRQSISGLELALRSVEDSLLGAVLKSGDPEQLWSLAESIHQTAVDERATDEADAVLDAACFNRQRAERFTRVRNVTKSEQRLTSDFINYWKLLAPGGVRRPSDDLAPGDIFEFDADKVAHGGFELPAPLRGGNRRFQGAFMREVVKDRPSLEFFAPGNGFFDAVINHANGALFGRVYGVEIDDLDSEPWVGIEVVCRAIPNVSLLDDNSYWLGRARQTFPAIRCSIFVELETGAAEEDSELLELRTGVRRDEKGRRWWNLRASDVSEYTRGATGTNWRDLIEPRITAGKHHAKSTMQPRVKARLAPELERLDSEFRRLSSEGRGETDELRNLRALRDSLAKWTVEIDALGLLSRGGGLRTGDGR